MPPNTPQTEQPDPNKLPLHGNTIYRLSFDYAKFGFMRGVTIICYAYAQTVYARTNVENLAASSDLAIFILVGNTWRELISPVSNPIKDAMDHNNAQKLQDLHRTAIMAGINPALGTWISNQIYAFVIPSLGRDSSQTWFIPTATLPTTIALMALTAEYTYGSIRAPNPIMKRLCASGALVIVCNELFRYLFDTSLLFLLMAQGVQCSVFVIASLIYLCRKYPSEKLFYSLFVPSKWKESYKEACHINYLGRLPFIVLLFEVAAGILVNSLLNPQSLGAFQPMSSVLMGFGNAVSQTFQQRDQFHIRQILNLLKTSPEIMRTALRRVLLHATWLSALLPILAGTAALIASDPFIDFLYNATPEKANIVAEAKSNILAVFGLLTLRFIAAAPIGMVFSVINSNDPYHRSLNNYSSITRAISPLAAAGIGYGLDSGFQMASMGYWVGAIIALSIATLINFYFACQLINYEYNTAKATVLQQGSERPELHENDVELEVISNVALEDAADPLVLPQQDVNDYSFFSRSTKFLREKVQLIPPFYEGLGLRGVGR